MSDSYIADRLAMIDAANYEMEMAAAGVAVLMPDLTRQRVHEIVNERVHVSGMGGTWPSRAALYRDLHQWVSGGLDIDEWARCPYRSELVIAIVNAYAT